MTIAQAGSGRGHRPEGIQFPFRGAYDRKTRAIGFNTEKQSRLRISSACRARTGMSGYDERVAGESRGFSRPGAGRIYRDICGKGVNTGQ